MRTEVKVGLIAGLVVIVGGIIFFFQQSQQTGGDVANSLPMDAPPPQMAKDTGKTADKAVTPSRRTAEGRAELAADAERKPQQRKQRPETRADQPDRPGTSREDSVADADEIQARLREAIARRRAAQEKASPTAARPKEKPEEKTEEAVTQRPARRPTAAPPTAKGAEQPTAAASDKADAESPTKPDRKLADATPRPGVKPPERRPTRRPTQRPSQLPGKPSSQNVIRHTVQPGDSLWYLAERYYGDGLLWKKIAEANPEVVDNKLTVGKVIVVPPKDQVLAKKDEASDRNSRKPDARRHTYVVEHGDSLIGIARNILGDGSRWREIYELNREKIADPDVLKVGTELKLPPKQ